MLTWNQNDSENHTWDNITVCLKFEDPNVKIYFTDPRTGCALGISHCRRSTNGQDGVTCDDVFNAVLA